jgi:hypothetical protein
LLTRPYRILLTKGDLLAAPLIPASFGAREDVRLISAARGDGIDALVEEVHGMVAAERARDGSRVG